MMFMRVKQLRRGLTFVELVIGMAITAMVAVAVSAVMTSTSRGWEHSREIEQQTSQTSMTMVRINKVLRNAKQIGAVRVGGISGGVGQPATVLFWKADLNRDGKIQFSELAMLEHDPDGDAGEQIPAKSVVYWEVKYPAAWTTAQKQANDFEISQDTLRSDSEISPFRTGFPTLVRPSVLATGVAAVELHRIDSPTTLRPALEYMLKFDNGGEVTKYGRTTLRAPAIPPTQPG